MMCEFEDVLRGFQQILSGVSSTEPQTQIPTEAPPRTPTKPQTPTEPPSRTPTETQTPADAPSPTPTEAPPRTATKPQTPTDAPPKTSTETKADAQTRTRTGSDAASVAPPRAAAYSSPSTAYDGFYASQGIVKGKTIYHDDFNGAKGAHPNQAVFDTAHIGADGQTRQRGANIDEDAIVSSNNTEMDGNGNLELFPVKQTTYDPVAKENVDYTTGSMNTGKGLNFNLKNYPNGLVIEVRAKHPTAPGAKFDALWLMTDHWAADPKKGESKGDTVEFDAAEGGGADITVHYPTVNSDGKPQDNYGGGAHPKDVNIDDGQYHTYTVVIRPNAKTGKGDITEYIDGNKEFSQANVLPADKDIHLRSSLEISPKWTHQTYTGNGGMGSSAAGMIDYLDVSELAPRQGQSSK